MDMVVVINQCKKVLLRERKRHTARRIESTCYAALSNGGRGVTQSNPGQGGYPIESWLWGRVPHWVLVRGRPHPVLARGGLPHPVLARGGYPGYPPIIQICNGVSPIQSCNGVPPFNWIGYSLPGPGVPLISWIGYPLDLESGTPHQVDEVPPIWT